MRHRVAGKKLNRSTSHRTALRRNLIKQLFRHEQIRTTR
ncbi:MAG: 50S ribosomal protein L17, partial [Chloroflexi bacterium]|nr:50S ribosomal protein L17 [Chloroflexota bacterium]